VELRALEGGTRRSWSETAVRLGPGVLAAVALATCVDQLLRPHALLGVDGYDDGVYLGAAVRLAHGVVPYRDFVFPHPPGSLLLLLPLALLSRRTGTRTFVGEGRVLTALVAAANVFLLARLVRHRGAAAVVVAGSVAATFPLAVNADKTVLLEPYLVLFCLLGTCVLFEGDELAGERRLGWAGLAFGLAGAIKIWAVFPFAIALLCCAPHRRRAVPLLLGAAAGFVAVSLPFFALAPRTYVRDVLVVQLTRAPSAGGISVGRRLADLTGVGGMPDVGASVDAAVAVAAGFVLLVACAFLVTPRPRRLDWFALGSAVAAVVPMLAAPDFFHHYAYFTIFFLALLLGLSCDRLLRALASRTAGRNLRRVSAAGLAFVVLTGVFALVEGRRLLLAEPRVLGTGDPGPAIARAIPRGACVVTDQPALTLVADRFVPRGGCPAIVDPFYTWLAYGQAKPPPSKGPYSERLVAAWRSWFSTADDAVLSRRASRIPWSPALRAWFRQHFRRVAGSRGTVVYRRDG
jgi:hypothetical protein